MSRRGVIDETPLRLEPERVLESVDWLGVFGSEAPVEIEIGIGKGRFVLAAAAERPETNHLAVEWSMQYLRIAESRAFKRGLKNVRFVRVDAGELLLAIPASSVSAYYVFYPDPWPKKRHHKRRFFKPQTADELARTLRPGGLLHVATDHDSYWEVIEPLLDRHAAFERQAVFGGEDFPLSVDAPLTNFEIKYAREGRSRNRASWRRAAG